MIDLTALQDTLTANEDVDQVIVSARLFVKLVRELGRGVCTHDLFDENGGVFFISRRGDPIALYISADCSREDRRRQE